MSEIKNFLDQIHQFPLHSHKGQNGKTLIIGGSDLFHAASQWSFRAASRLVDMTFYSSIDENNELLRDAKMYGHDGVIIRREDLTYYLEEVDSVLIGPGMRRDYADIPSRDEFDRGNVPLDWQDDTEGIVEVLLRGFPDKQWILDAGALQLVQKSWLPAHSILTPHQGEFLKFLEQFSEFPDYEFVNALQNWQKSFLSDRPYSRPARIYSFEQLQLPKEWKEAFLYLSQESNDAHFIVKGALDFVWNNEEVWVIDGGNAGMTKGGTGDVLAGLLAGLTACSPPMPSMIVASYLNKQAGHQLYQRQNTMFNASDLVDEIPLVWQELNA